VVSACFPSSQSFLEVKLKECEMAVEQGADEVDIVLALNSFLAEDYEKAAEEIRQVRRCIDEVAGRQGRKVHLKVILETGLLRTPERIAQASFLAMEAGADFIKTSTGKVDVNATPVAAYVMCECIAKFYAATGKKIGFKPAGGISSAADALCYYSIVSSVLGKEWLNKEYFRFGVSRVANSILSAVEQKTVSYY
jgi:deoxyribose-phosphate aldolase